MLHPGDYWIYAVTGDILPPPSPQAPKGALPLGGVILNEIRVLPFQGKPTLALVATQNLTVAGASLFGQNTPPQGIFYLRQNPETRDVFVIGDNLNPDGTDRVAVQPRVFYPGAWSLSTAYSHTVEWKSGATTRLSLSVSGREQIATVIGDFEAWAAPTGSVESIGVENAGTDWWTPQLGAPVKFDTVTSLPNGGRNHVIGTLIKSNRVRSLYPVVAGGLDHPRGLAFDRGGSLWITEAGKGGAGPCVGSQNGGEQCFGRSGRVSRLREGRRETVIGDLGSLATPLLDQATGPNGIAFRDGEPYVVIGNAGSKQATEELGEFQKQTGILVSLQRDDNENDDADVKTAALLSRFEFIHRPDNLFDANGQLRAESNPFGVASMGEDVYVTDAAGHTALKVLRGGGISAIAVLPFQSINKPAFPGGPAPVLVESVPTGIIAAPDGKGLLVADYTGFPFFPGTSRIWRVRQNHEPQVYAAGFTNLIGISAAQDGGVYALEMTSKGFLSGDPAGAVIHVAPSGERSVLACSGLVYPAGIATSPEGDVYVSNYGVIPGQGEIVRISASPDDDSDGKR